MVVEDHVLTIFQWLGPALSAFALTFAVVTAAGLVLAYLVAAFRNGPVRGFQVVLHYLLQAPIDLFNISPRRVLGLTRLAIRESLRRRVWIALVLFGVILMFAGWKLSPDTDEPAKLYLNFVLSATTYLMLPIAVFTAAFSLPNDIRNRTIHTITTKPVRPSEIVLGRMLGFCVVMTGLLAVMGLASYVFVARGLQHTHQLDAQEMVARQTQGKRIYEGTTSLARRHRHDVRLDGESFLPEVDFVPSPDAGGVTIVELGDAAAASGLAVGDKIVEIGGQPADALVGDAILDVLRGGPGSTVAMRIERDGKPLTVNVVRSIQALETSTDNGHKHRVVARWVTDAGQEGALAYEVGPAEGMLVARVPRYGRLRFRDRRGDPKDPQTWEFKETAANIGKMFSYRSYIQGNTLAAAVWTFDGVTAESYPDGLPLELTIRVYRSHMGKIDEGVTGSIVMRNPETGVESREQIFTGKDFAIDRINIPRRLYDSQDNRVDLFDALVTSDGRTEVWMRCLKPGQYFGMARADVYLSAREASYTVNFLKGLAGIWLQVMLVTGLAVLFSTFLSGPIAMLLTVTAIILGFNRGFLDHVAISVLDPENMKQLVASHERYYGGGPIEAFYRIITQNNLVTELDESMLTTIIKKSDLVLVTCVDKMLRLMPDFEQFSEVKYLSHGYDINGHLLLQHALTTLAFLLAAYVIGYFMLKTREMAQ